MVISTLITRISELETPCNRTDILIELALFKPDENYVSACANNAVTKVIFTRTNGERETCWAYDYTLTPERRAKSITLLRAREAGQP